VASGHAIRQLTLQGEQKLVLVFRESQTLNRM
jgi:hypothetical protein